MENFRLLLIGPAGSGKSSFCNTVASVFRGRITQRSAARESPQIVTTKVSLKNINIHKTLKYPFVTSQLAEK